MKQVHYDLTEKQLNKKIDAAIGNNIVLVLGVLMEEYHMDADDMTKFMKRYENYAEGVSRGWINPRFIAVAIKETTGLEVKWDADL